MAHVVDIDELSRRGHTKQTTDDARGCNAPDAIEIPIRGLNQRLVRRTAISGVVQGMQRDERAARRDTKDAAIIRCRSTRGPSVEVPIVAQYKRSRICSIGALRGRAKTME